MANGGTGRSTGIERRAAPRCVLDVHAVPVDLGFERGALLLDLSASGLCVQAISPAPVGTTTDLHFQLPGTPARVDGMGTVTWSDGSGRLGLRFDELTALSRPHLTTWLLRAQPAPPGPARGAAGPDAIAQLRCDLLAQGLTGDEALAFVLERTRSISRATGAAIALGNGVDFLCRSSSGAAPAVGAPLDPDSGLSGQCVRTGQLVRCDDTETDPRVDRVVCRALHVRAVVIVPIRAQRRLIGVLEVFSPQARAFQGSDIFLLRDAADLIAELTSGPAAGEVAIAASGPTSQPKPAQPANAPAPPPGAVLAMLREASATAALEPADGLSWRLKILLVALALTMLAGSGWAGWHWGQWRAISRPAAAPAVLSTTAQAAAAATVAVENRLSAVPGAAAAAPGVLRPHKRSVPVLVLPPPVTVPSSASDEPPPAVAGDRGSEAAGLGTVLSTSAAPASLAKPPSVSQGVTGGRLIRRVEPVYSLTARDLHLRGTVVLKAGVDIHGRVVRVAVLSGDPLLAEAAANAVKSWRYEPFLLNGVPVENDVTVKVTFVDRE